MVGLRLLGCAGAGLISIALLGSCGQHEGDRMAGYDRIGSVGSDVLFARVDHENDGEYVDVQVRDEDGNLLCHGRGPLMMTDQQTPAVCDDASPNMYVYVGQQPKRGVVAPMCRESGEPLALPRLVTDSTWLADFVLWVDRSGDDFPLVSLCGPVSAD